MRVPPPAHPGRARTTSPAGPPATAPNQRRGPTAIDWRILFERLTGRAREWVEELGRPPAPKPEAAAPVSAAAPARYDRLTHVTLTDEVARTLFEEYAAHRASDRGNEETGWVLLGLREADHAVVTATMPAATDRDAGEAHVWITGPAHGFASRVVRQHDRRVLMLGVVHTHPGRLRHPSAGDLRGDREWVGNVRGGEGVFGIGTADAESDPAPEPVATHPKPHAQCLGPLRFSWYSLATGDKKYHPLPVELTIGPDRGRPLRPVWEQVEAHADRLDRLARQLARVRFEVADGRHGPALVATVGLPNPDDRIRVVMEGKEVRYFYESGGDVFAPDLPDVPPDQGVYLLLAELAARG